MANRFWEIDTTRGLALIGMIIFHTLWNLNYFGYTNFGLYSGSIGIFQKVIAVSFLGLVGISLTISSSRRQNYKQWFLKRGLFIFSLGLVITAFTYLFFREGLIYFGILHLIGISIILAIPFVKRIYTSLVAGVGIILAGYYLHMINFFAPPPTFDYYPLLPWFGVILIGIAIGNILYKNGERAFKIKEIKNPISILGKYSLVIYFAHQPILFGLLLLAT